MSEIQCCSIRQPSSWLLSYNLEEIPSEVRASPHWTSAKKSSPVMWMACPSKECWAVGRYPSVGHSPWKFREKCLDSCCWVLCLCLAPLWCSSRLMGRGLTMTSLLHSLCNIYIIQEVVVVFFFVWLIFFYCFVGFFLWFFSPPFNESKCFLWIFF